MNLFEIIKGWDTQLFLFINGIHSPFFDNFMYQVSNKLVWIPFYAAVLFTLIKYRKKESLWLALALILCIVISDQVASGILKNLVKRLRPSHVESLSSVIHLVKGYGGGGLYGFASSHASNSVGFALLSAMIFRKRVYTILIFFWAAITAYSRIYLGAHYPLDIIAGVLIGMLAAAFCYWLIIKFRPIAINERGIDEKFPSMILIISFLAIIIYSFMV
jgi:undecaprenyl-diphosphatase